jgi:hypothetical protein
VVRVLGRLFLLRAVLLLMIWVGGVRTSAGCLNHGLSALEPESRTRWWEARRDCDWGWRGGERGIGSEPTARCVGLSQLADSTVLGL